MLTTDVHSEAAHCAVLLPSVEGYSQIRQLHMNKNGEGEREGERDRERDRDRERNRDRERKRQREKARER